MSCKTSFQLSFEGEFNLYTITEHLSRHVKDGERVSITLVGVVSGAEPAEISDAAE